MKKCGLRPCSLNDVNSWVSLLILLHSVPLSCQRIGQTEGAFSSRCRWMSARPSPTMTPTPAPPAAGLPYQDLSVSQASMTEEAAGRGMLKYWGFWGWKAPETNQMLGWRLPWLDQNDEIYKKIQLLTLFCFRDSLCNNATKTKTPFIFIVFYLVNIWNQFPL